jgi:dolichyl-phosphate-mannose--protein O-mannosyl transferase
MAAFKLHFLILNHSGPGDAQMSSLFQANLVGNDFSNNPLGMYSHLVYQCHLTRVQILHMGPK